MESALSLNRLNEMVSEKYAYDEQRIVGIILARYDLKITQALVDSCYLYWHENTGGVLDFYWAGYGEYLCPNHETRDRIILKFDGNDTRVFYDRRAFISFKNELNHFYKNSYRDKVQLVLVNYRKGKLRYDESIKIDLEENVAQNLGTIRELVEFITNECSGTHDVISLSKKLFGERIKGYVKNQIKGVSLSEVVNAGLGVVGIQNPTNC